MTIMHRLNLAFGVKGWCVCTVRANASPRRAGPETGREVGFRQNQWSNYHNRFAIHKLYALVSRQDNNLWWLHDV